MNTTSTVIATMACPFCTAKLHNPCITATGRTLTGVHLQRRRAYDRYAMVGSRKRISVAQANLTSDTPVSESTPPPQSSEIRALLNSNIEMARSLHKVAVQVIELASLVKDSHDRIDHLEAVNESLEAKLTRLLIAQAADGVAAHFYGGPEPHFEDVWEVDEWKLGEDLRYRTDVTEVSNA